MPPIRNYTHWTPIFFLNYWSLLFQKTMQLKPFIGNKCGIIFVLKIISQSAILQTLKRKRAWAFRFPLLVSHSLLYFRRGKTRHQRGLPKSQTENRNSIQSSHISSISREKEASQRDGLLWWRRNSPSWEYNLRVGFEQKESSKLQLEQKIFVNKEHESIHRLSFW